MEKEVLDLLNDDILSQSISKWDKDGKPENLKLLGDVENFVYEYKNGAGTNNAEKNFILRITHSSHRSKELILAELNWLNFLIENNITVCKPILSLDQSFAEVIELNDSYFIICAFEKADGLHIKYDENLITNNKEVISNLGKMVGRIHSVSKAYSETSECKRQQWFEEDLALNASKYLPFDKEEVLEEIESLKELFNTFSKDNDIYGLIHSDIHNGNFFVDNNNIILFDFDDSCYHWYIYDVSTIIYSYALSIKDESQRSFLAAEFAKIFLEGYFSENNLDKKWLALLPEMFKFRDLLIYVFLYKKWDIDNLDKRRESDIVYFNNLKDRTENYIPLIDFNYFPKY